MKCHLVLWKNFLCLISSCFLRQQETLETPVALPMDTVSNGNPEDVAAVDHDPSEVASPPSAVPMETEESVPVETVPADQEKTPAVPGHPCSMCNRMFMSMQGLRSHERSHSAVALVSRNDKYSCQYCHFSSPFRHK